MKKKMKTSDEDLHSFESVFDKYCDVTMQETEEESIVDPVTFITASWGLNRKLYPAQEFILKLFYGMDLNDEDKVIEYDDYVTKKSMSFTETEFLEYLSRTWFDKKPRINVSLLTDFDNFKPFELTLICGRRGGKTHLISDIVLYEVYKLIMFYNPQDHYGLSEGTTIGVQMVANSEDGVGKEWKEVKNGLQGSRFFKPYILGLSDASTTAKIQSPHDLERVKRNPYLKPEPYSVEIITSACDADTLRSKDNILIVLEELAHFKDKAKAKSSKRVYEALQPSVAGFGLDGKCLNLSSPKDKDKRNKCYELYTQSFDSDAMLMLQLPTWEMNPTVKRRFLENVHKEDESFWREYGARFSESMSDFIKEDDKELFMRCIRRDSAGDFIIHPSKTIIPHCNYYLAVDPSLIHNGYSGAIAHAEGSSVVVDEIKLWYADDIPFTDELDEADERGPAPQIDIAQVEEWIFDNHRKRYRFKHVFFDQFECAYIIQRLRKKKSIQASSHFFTERFNSQIYSTFLSLMRQTRVNVYYHEGFIDQFMDLKQTNKAHNMIKVSAATKSDNLTGEGPGDDIADSVCHVVYEVYQREIVTKRKTTSSSGVTAATRRALQGAGGSRPGFGTGGSMRSGRSGGGRRAGF